MKYITNASTINLFKMKYITSANKINLFKMKYITSATAVNVFIKYITVIMYNNISLIMLNTYITDATRKMFAIFALCFFFLLLPG